MKTPALFFAFAFSASTVVAQQQDPCRARILKTPGSWGEISRTERVVAKELVIQKKFVNAVNAMLEGSFKPKNIRADRSFWHEPLSSDRPVTSYGVTLYAMPFRCEGDRVSVQYETSTKMTVVFNLFSEAEIFDVADQDALTGFHRLSRGLPVEVNPGIWQFPVKNVSLGFGITGSSKLSLITTDGQLPWQYVTRKEFLEKRKQYLQQQLDREPAHLQEQLDSWEMQKKFQTQMLKGDKSKMDNFITNTYDPGVAREKSNHKTAVEGWRKAIERVELQLQSPDLDKPALVINSKRNFRDYDFTDKADAFAEVLVKPNPAYFNRSPGVSVPQFIVSEIIWNPKDVVSNQFALDAEAALSNSYLKSFIGKNVPGPKP